MPNLSRTCHAVGVADRYGTAIHVVDFRVNAKMITAIQNLAGEGFVELPTAYADQMRRRAAKSNVLVMLNLDAGG